MEINIVSRLWKNLDKKWVCPECKFWKGNYSCAKNVYIPVVGCDTSSCIYFEIGQECPHCGKNF